MPIAQQIVPGLLQLNIIVLQLLKDALINHNGILPDNNPLINFGLLPDQIIPLTLLNLRNLKPRFGVDIEYLLHEVLGIGRDELWDFELAGQDLLVQAVGVLVFEGQVAAQQRVHDDAARPDVDVQAVVELTGDHLGGGVAGRTAGCFELLAWFVLVA